MTVTNPVGGGLMTTGGAASAIVAQSIGGGGGIAGGGTDAFETIGGGKAGVASQSITVGAVFTSGSNGELPVGSGQTVTVNHAGEIQTSSDWSHGILAQSIGGGGGLGSAYATASVSVDLSMQVGSTGTYAGTGDGGTVNINLGANDSTTIVTGSQTTTNGVTTRTGYAAFGILAQSIGGGGGLGMSYSDGGTAPNSSIGLGGGGIGVGSDVTLTGDASVTTYGDAAHAVVLQSIGAGGGIAGQGSSAATGTPGPNVSLAMNGEVAEGNAGTVTVKERGAHDPDLRRERLRGPGAVDRRRRRTALRAGPGDDEPLGGLLQHGRDFRRPMRRRCRSTCRPARSRPPVTAPMPSWRRVSAAGAVSSATRQSRSRSRSARSAP